MAQITEVPETPKLRCPENADHKTFTVRSKTSRVVDENLRPVPGTGPGKAKCTECGATARVREQLNG